MLSSVSCRATKASFGRRARVMAHVAQQPELIVEANVWNGLNPKMQGQGMREVVRPWRNRFLGGIAVQI